VTSARENILARVRKALGKSAENPADVSSAEAYMREHRHGPRPDMPADMHACFAQRAVDMASTLEAVPSRAEIPRAVARYLDAIEWPAQLADQMTKRGVCWPEFGELDWAGAGLQIEVRPNEGDDKLGITGVYCAIAETGTLVLISGANTPTASALLPDTHIAVVPRNRIVSGMEEAYALIRSECGGMPRAINFISGPSRTADIEQTLVLGAHGPYRVHILVVPE
jgi:L-lactate dehydrogenase complex protein LldG